MPAAKLGGLLCFGYARSSDGVPVGGSKSDAAAGGAAGTAAAVFFVLGCSSSWERDGPVRSRGQEDKEREAVQGVVRQRSAEEGEEDRADQGPDRGPQVHPLAPPLQAHLISS